MAESISLGDRELIELVMLRRKSQMEDRVNGSLPNLYAHLENVSTSSSSSSAPSLRHFTFCGGGVWGRRILIHAIKKIFFFFSFF